jgi:hypothetical protein
MSSSKRTRSHAPRLSTKYGQARVLTDHADRVLTARVHLEQLPGPEALSCIIHQLAIEHEGQLARTVRVLRDTHAHRQIRDQGAVLRKPRIKQHARASVAARQPSCWIRDRAQRVACGVRVYTSTCAA